MEQPKEKKESESTSSGQDGWRIIARVDNEVFIKIHSKDVTARSLSNWLDENGWQPRNMSLKRDLESKRTSVNSIVFENELVAVKFCEYCGFVQEDDIEPRCGSSSSDTESVTTVSIVDSRDTYIIERETKTSSFLKRCLNRNMTRKHW